MLVFWSKQILTFMHPNRRFSPQTPNPKPQKKKKKAEEKLIHDIG
jgi:hypothetical protein